MKCKEVKILMTAALFALASPAMALISFDDGGVHSLNSETYDDVWVDYLKPGMATTLNILDGMSQDEPYHVKCWEDGIINVLDGYINKFDAYSRSQVDMSGGSIVSLSAYGTSQVTVSGGSIGRYLYAYDSSQVTVSDGSISRHLYAYDSSQVTVSGGSMGDLPANDSSQVTVSGGSMRDLHARGSSRIDMSGGSINGSLFALHSSQVTVSGGSINNYLYAGGTSQVTVSDGSMGDLFTNDTSQVTVSGGSMGFLYADHSSQITVSGGEILQPLVVVGEGTLSIYGSGFAVDGTPVGYTELASIFGGNYQDEPHRRLTGTLLSGESLDWQFRIGNAGKIILAPSAAAPTADAGDDQTVIDVDGNGSESITLDGSGSTGGEGTIVSWVWTDSFGDTIPDGEIVTANLSVGIHIVTLTVTDDDSLSTSDTVTIIVEALGIPPVAEAGDNQDAIDSDDNGSEPITLDGSASYDTDGSIVLWMWTDSLGDPIPDGEIVTADLSVGIHIITLTVADNDGLPDTDTVTVTVQPLGAPPVADAGEDILADADELVVLDASASYDPDGQIVLYTWTALPEGIVLYTGQDPTFATSAIGRVEEVMKLTVTDNRGGTAEDTMSIFNRTLAEIELTPGPEGPQGEPGMTPEEVAEMQEQIAELHEEVAELKEQINELKELLEDLQQVNTDLEQTVLDNRWLLEQLPQLRKDFDELESRTDE